uniref:DNA polymerase III subunit epsilon n=1 Tax=Candidatus Kentrum sp. FM TaxID=2126340 RepID=A0A450TAV4_9GAMM|nr:MAG: DNA polymerase-3 subunit epsilon [Candidatus Kentron sp. FM]VFJ64331.1 MAG: DNA polymerase-3 subunit epsilon [Candidatus Kentron sp. FM]VFK15119.1 MAG: DNA polymerase-3 subunit epsilon [Candidatus Kentron sp. FM]
MRQVVLDTETTGLDITQGHRVIELGAREIIDRQLTDRCFHHYLQPDRDIDWGAQAVHGITRVFLQDKPRFADIAGEFIAFIRDAELIIHNAPFDVGFLDGELKRLGPQWGRMQDYATIVDTLVMARTRYPGQKNTLDALCKRYRVDNSKRDLHGALLDAEILARIYLVMTGGQISLALETPRPRMPDDWFDPANAKGKRPPPRVIRATPEELAAHTARLAAIDKASGGKCLWK